MYFTPVIPYDSVGNYNIKSNKFLELVGTIQSNTLSLILTVKG